MHSIHANVIKYIPSLTPERAIYYKGWKLGEKECIYKQIKYTKKKSMEVKIKKIKKESPIQEETWIPEFLTGSNWWMVLHCDYM